MERLMVANRGRLGASEKCGHCRHVQQESDGLSRGGSNWISGKVSSRPSGEDLQQKVREAQALWDKLGKIPTPPENPDPLSLDLDAYTGVYNSEPYGKFYVIREGDTLRIEAGPNRYPRTLEHWTNNTFLLMQ